VNNFGGAYGERLVFFGTSSFQSIEEKEEAHKFLVGWCQSSAATLEAIVELELLRHPITRPLRLQRRSSSAGPDRLTLFSSYWRKRAEKAKNPSFIGVLEGKDWWQDPELNRGHKDFQSSALPTELSCQPEPLIELGFAPDGKCEFK
jgi:hypothetical protein